MKMKHKYNTAIAFTASILSIVSLVLLSLSATIMNAQTTERIFYSEFFPEKEARTVKIWLPSTYNYLPLSNVLYVFDADYYFDYTAATVDYLCKLGYIPPMAVVGVFYRDKTDRTDVGFNDDITLNKYGQAFFNYLTKEVMPYVNNSVLNIERPYNLYLGHSYLAKYASYYIKNHPDIFDAYLLFAPEYSIVTPQFDKEQLNAKRFFIAVGTDDAERRLLFANNLYKALHDAANPNFSQLKIIENAGHMDIVPHTLFAALPFIYRDYIARGNIEDYINESIAAIDNYKVLNDLNMANYRCELPLKAGVVMDLFSDTLKFTIEDLKYITDKTKNYPDANLQEIIGFTYLELGDTGKAEELFNLALELCRQNSTLHHSHNIYRGLLEIYKEQANSYEKQLAIIDAAMIDQPRSFLWYRTRGYLHIDNNNFKEGIADLKVFVDNYYVEGDWGKARVCETYCRIASAYHALGELKESEQWTDMALSINPDYQDAINLKKILKRGS